MDDDDELLRRFAALRSVPSALLSDDPPASPTQRGTLEDRALRAKAEDETLSAIAHGRELSEISTLRYIKVENDDTDLLKRFESLYGARRGVKEDQSAIGEDDEVKFVLTCSLNGLGKHR